ncbi:DUF3240 family protein [Stakelama tenebrarum]|uniref:DUF3240 domain-containing protein n=1 Tax=Stakelama tenebrarum TaxID=2711215 RepID=A0A6G6Y2L6_9SPHN|nr:DUF3240 family protein [Sphingosinithalassobacter tenebrarum]QIG79047.1 DUF3240 domain-containing protein [Sphingosinithalassobacter tenebrarum]
MADVLLTIHCARSDATAIARALRDATGVAVHEIDEAVHGHDFGDADTAEQVSGELRRSLLQLLVSRDHVEPTVEAARTARRRLPIRWHAVAVLASGRCE